MNILETNRLYLRELSMDDIQDLNEILQDEDVMYAYEHAFSNEEVMNWLLQQRNRYQQDGFGLWAMIRKDDGNMVGQCGLSWQNVEGERLLEVGYLLKKRYWHKGYAIEAASACKTYAFETLQTSRIVSIIRDNNTPSQQVALRNGMKPGKTFTKFYHNVYMPHIVFEVKKEEIK